MPRKRARGRCATVDGMVFHEPVFVGDEVSCCGELARVRVEAWRRHLPSLDARKVTGAIFTYVAVGETGGLVHRTLAVRFTLPSRGRVR